MATLAFSTPGIPEATPDSFISTEEIHRRLSGKSSASQVEQWAHLTPSQRLGVLRDIRRENERLVHTISTDLSVSGACVPRNQCSLIPRRTSSA